MGEAAAPDLETARQAVEAALRAAQALWRLLAERSLEGDRLSVEKLDQYQVLAYDLAVCHTELSAAQVALDRTPGAEPGAGSADDWALADLVAVLFAGEAVREAQALVQRHIADFLLPVDLLGTTLHSPLVEAFAVESGRAARYEAVCDQAATRRLLDDPALPDRYRSVRDTFRRFAEQEVMPQAEAIHRDDLLVPEAIISGLAELGCFGLSVPLAYGGLQDPEHPDYVSMLLVTEELSRGSLGAAGSLTTRPEILIRALLRGGTEEQKRRWLPAVAAGEKMVAISVTEPDFGSDVAGIKTLATRDGDVYKINGQKMWCTFGGRADLILLLTRTDPDISLGHRGLSMFVIEKPRYEGHEFVHEQEGGGKLTARATRTLGYRGMHSFELLFEDYVVPAANLIGGEGGLGKGFYLQMAGFAAGRLQTAGRALGLMQAAYENALAYGENRRVFGQPVGRYALTRHKLARMALLLQVGRRFSYHAARAMDRGQGDLEASMAKLFCSRAAGWVTHEAQQIQGGLGYAEESAVARYFVDARVLPIFEGTEEVLALRIIARTLAEQQLRQREPARA